MLAQVGRFVRWPDSSLDKAQMRQKGLLRAWQLVQWLLDGQEGRIPHNMRISSIMAGRTKEAE